MRKRLPEHLLKMMQIASFDPAIVPSKLGKEKEQRSVSNFLTWPMRPHFTWVSTFVCTPLHKCFRQILNILAMEHKISTPTPTQCSPLLHYRAMWGIRSSSDRYANLIKDCSVILTNNRIDANMMPACEGTNRF